MKLYSEEQVRRLIEGYYDVNWTIYDEFDELTPIELPSDEELEEWIVNRNYEFSRVDIQTTKWVIEQIKQQDNGK